MKCVSRPPDLEFRCRIVSREEGYCVSWVPLGVERVACMTAAYLKTLAVICLTKLFGNSSNSVPIRYVRRSVNWENLNVYLLNVYTHC